MKFAEVAVYSNVNGIFDYHIPETMPVQIGHLVRVSFGTNQLPAIVIAIKETSQVPETKPILTLLDDEPILLEQYIQVGRWMATYYRTPLGQVLWTWLPPSVTGSSRQIVRLIDENADVSGKVQQAIIDELRDAQANGQYELTTMQLQKRLKRKSLNSSLNSLIKAGIIERHSQLSRPNVRTKRLVTIRLAIAPDELSLHGLGKKQKRILNYLSLRDYTIDMPELSEETNATKADLRKLADKGFIHLGERIAYRDSLADRDFVPSYPLKLTSAQNLAWQTIKSTMGQGQRYLLHGVTGSGKTEIYLTAIDHVIKQDQQAIFLVPEIALTPQTIRRVAERFPDQVAVVHGSLSLGERYDTWTRARQGQINVIVGTRSALFTPLPNLGLIIIDEEHDSSYKHSPPFNPPYYHARTVAREIAKSTNATLILGSATPDLQTYYQAERGDYTYLHLPERIMGHRQRLQQQSQKRGQNPCYQELVDTEAMFTELPPVEVVDMREELKSGNRNMFSRSLHSALYDVLARSEQALLLLNRRGSASYVFCRDCGYVVLCERCDMPMTYHREGETLRCHHCGNTQNPVTTCPNCHSRRIRYFGAGTQSVVDELYTHFPEARVIRWDTDTASSTEDHEEILATFINQEADIIVGTQMIAKGLDLPYVTLVGVISADPGLQLPDFRAQERGFQLLTQVAGRAGRGVLGGRVVIQTYSPQHPAIVHASRHDYTGFYAEEIEDRRDLGYPPFRRLIRILIQSTHPYNVQREAEHIASELKQRIYELNLTDTTIIGPAPAFFGKIDKQFRWQLLIRTSDPSSLLHDFHLRQGVYLDIDPVDIL